MKTCIIKIHPENKSQQASLDTNGVSKLEIIDVLNGLIKVLAQQLVEEAKQHVGDDQEAIAKWIDQMRQKPEQN